jgi:hypothetical protein
VRAVPLALAILGTLGVLAAAAGAAVRLAGDLSMGELVALLFVATFLASASATQLYRRALPGSTLLGALAGAWSVLAYFAAPFFLLPALGILTAPDAHAISTFMVVAPLVCAALSAMGTLVLQQGVRRYRARHGLVHVPR